MEMITKEYLKLIRIGCLELLQISLKINTWKKDSIKYIKEEELIKEKTFLNIQKKSYYQCKLFMLRPFKILKRPLEFLKTLIECQLLNKLI